MSRVHKPHPIVSNIPITNYAAEGFALTRVEERVIFVPYAAPGDVADIQITKKKKNYAEGRIVRLICPSPIRIPPVCAHFGVCGGCKWQHIPYEEQVKFKQQQVLDHLTRIGKLDLPIPDPIKGSARTFAYRNKLEFTFSDKAWLTADEMNLPDEQKTKNALGFHIPGMFDKVLHIHCCHLQEDISNRIRVSVHAYCQRRGISYFNLKSQQGMMRNLIIRTSATTGQIMVIVVFFEKDEVVWQGLLTHIAESFPEITSLLYVHNQKANDTLQDQEIQVFRGADHITETMEQLRFKIGPKSFYQTNSLQAYELYKVVREFAGLTGKELVYDLYTGTGTIANFVASRAKQVIGIEYIPEAIEDAKINATYNHLDNTLFFAGDMKDLLNEDFLACYGRPEVIITDPPRAGMHEDVIQTILAAAPRRMVYVSCNAATQARDLHLLDPAYRVTRLQAVDMFPHTQHVESVALLERR